MDTTARCRRPNRPAGSARPSPARSSRDARCRNRISAESQGGSCSAIRGQYQGGVIRAAEDRDQSDLRVLHLGGSPLASNLPDGLDNMGNPWDVGMREMAAVSVDGKRTARARTASADETRALARLAEAQAFQLQHD